MLFARLLFFAVVFLICPRASSAQSEVSGRYLVEPVVGRFFSVESDHVDVFGGRATWRRSYSRSHYAAFIYGRNTEGGTHQDPEGRSEFRHMERYAIGTIGAGSTIVDRDATGSVGAHVLAGLGVVSFLVQRDWTFDGPNLPSERSESHYLSAGPLVDLALIGELELFSPRVLLRVQTGTYLALKIRGRQHDGVIWYPGASITAGLAAAF